MGHANHMDKLPVGVHHLLFIAAVYLVDETLGGRNPMKVNGTLSFVVPN
jgi:hypothetical protein